MLCNTADWVADAKLMKAAFHELDPGFAPPRPVSANQNGWIGINTPLDVQGFDYSTQVRKGREREELSGSKRGEGVAVPHLVVPRLTSPPPHPELRRLAHRRTQHPFHLFGDVLCRLGSRRVRQQPDGWPRAGIRQPISRVGRECGTGMGWRGRKEWSGHPHAPLYLWWLDMDR